MTDPLTDTALTKGRERSAPGMSHADTHTPLHGPTGGVPSFRQGTHSPTRQPQHRVLEAHSTDLRVLVGYLRASPIALRVGVSYRSIFSRT
eukprot:scaffold6333_cov125-Isochrysis_galbana.AAC.2